MAYSRITGTRNGADAIDYARGNGNNYFCEEKHNTAYYNFERIKILLKNRA